jgi:hypothetical protein
MTMKRAMISDRGGGGLFPLTPALSLGEREKRSPSFGKIMAVSCPDGCEFYEISLRLSLLPWGEGQDEGEAGLDSKDDTTNLFMR